MSGLATWLVVTYSLGALTTFLADESFARGSSYVWIKHSKSPLRLRGGYVITERILAARVKLLQEHNAERWRNGSTSAPVYPWHTWEANQQLLKEQVESTVGWAVPGAENFMGLTHDQAEKFEALEEEIAEKNFNLGIKDRRKLFDDVIKSLDDDPLLQDKLSNFKDDLEETKKTISNEPMKSYEKYLSEKRAKRLQELLDEDDLRLMEVPKLEEATSAQRNDSKPYKTVHRVDVPDFIESEVDATFEFVASDNSAENDEFDINKMEFSSTSDDLADVEAKEKHYVPDKFPIHGCSMKATTKFEGRDLLLELGRPQGRTRLRIKKGYQKEEMVPGGKLYEVALKLNNGRELKPGQIFLFPSKFKDKLFCVDPAGSGCIIPVEEIPDEDAELKAKRRKKRKLGLYMQRVLKNFKKMEDKDKCVFFLCEEEGLPMGWICRASRDLKYRSYIYKDGQEFLELDEAKKYANLTRLEKTEYSFQRTTQVGNVHSSYASVDLKNNFPVCSSIAATYGPHYLEYKKSAPGLTPELDKYYTTFRQYFDEEQQQKKEQEDADLVAGSVLKGIRRQRGQLNTTLVSSSSHFLSQTFITSMNATHLNLRELFGLCHFGMPDICSLNVNNTKQAIFRLRSQLWRLLTATLPTSKALWEKSLKTWRLTHEKVVLSTCQEVDFAPQQLFRQHEWDEGGMVMFEHGNMSSFYDIDDLVKEKLAETDLEIGTDQRWKRHYANPGLTMDSDGNVVVAKQQGAGRSLEQRWRDFFAAQDLWHAIQYDTYNGTYPQLYHLMPDEKPGNPERMRELQLRESLGIISNAEAEELYWLQEMHYDCCFGVYPGVMLPDELMHVTTRIIYTYIRLHPKVEYSPDMHHLLAPVLWICMRDPEHGVRDGLEDRERSVKHRRLDQVEADTLSLFVSLAGQFFRHWENVPGTSLDVVGAVAIRVKDRILQTDPELGQRMFEELKIKPEQFVSPWLTTFFSRVLPLWNLLPLWEALLASEDRSSFITDVCVAFVSIPEVRTRAFFSGSEELLLHLLFPPAITLDSIFLKVAALQAKFPVPENQVPALMRRDAAMLEAARERTELVRWSSRLVLNRLDNNGTRVKHLPYVNADGSHGFRLATGGGFGYARKPWSEKNTNARKFTEFRHIIPRLRLLGNDRAAPLDGSFLVQEQLARIPSWTGREREEEARDVGTKVSMSNFSLVGDGGEEEEETNTLISDDSMSVKSTRWRDVGGGRVWNPLSISHPPSWRKNLKVHFRSHIEKMISGKKTRVADPVEGTQKKGDEGEADRSDTAAFAGENSLSEQPLHDVDVKMKDDFNLTASLLQIPVENVEQARDEQDEEQDQQDGQDGQDDKDGQDKQGDQDEPKVADATAGTETNETGESEDMNIEESRSGLSYENEPYIMPKYRYHRKLEGEHDERIKEIKEEYLRSLLE